MNLREELANLKRRKNSEEFKKIKSFLTTEVLTGKLEVYLDINSPLYFSGLEVILKEEGLSVKYTSDQREGDFITISGW